MQLPDLKEARKRTKAEVDVVRFNKEDKYKNIVKNKYYFVKTYGCQMNEHDSENIKAMLEYMGYKNTDTLEKSDIVILNTCSIRENANNKVFGFLGRVKHLKNFKKDLIVGITGCMTQEEVIANKLLEKYKWVNFVVGTHMLDKINEEVYNAINGSKLDIIAPSIEGNIIEDLPVRRESKYKAYINIQLGCDKFCTYCIVPYTRGKQRSRHKEDILNEVIKLKEEGYKEITLLGQNVNAYGKDLDINYGMANLLEDVANTGIERIRFVTSHPWDFTDEMIEIIKKYDNIMPYIHLPLQSGSNNILKLMGRRYTKESYLKLFEKLKKTIPNVSITTDIIVGFPNETLDDFNETLEVVNKCKFDSAFTFIFSPREGTPAAKMNDSISLEEKNRRLYELNEVVNKYALENNMKYLNQTVKVLLEETSKKDENMLVGYTETMKLVNVKADKKYIGKIVDVKITDVKTWSMDGTIEK